MKDVKTVELRYCEGTSDKVYIIKMRNHGPTYSVDCEYGRRGYDLKFTSKGIFYSLAEANAVFDKVLLEKTKKGYTIQVETPSPIYTSVEVTADKPNDEVVSGVESKECGKDAREKALARLKSSSVW